MDPDFTSVKAQSYLSIIGSYTQLTVAPITDGVTGFDREIFELALYKATTEKLRKQIDTANQFLLNKRLIVSQAEREGITLLEEHVSPHGLDCHPVVRAVQNSIQNLMDQVETLENNGFSREIFNEIEYVSIPMYEQYLPSFTKKQRRYKFRTNLILEAFNDLKRMSEKRHLNGS